MFRQLANRRSRAESYCCPDVIKLYLFLRTHVQFESVSNGVRGFYVYLSRFSDPELDVPKKCFVYRQVLFMRFAAFKKNGSASRPADMAINF